MKALFMLAVLVASGSFSAHGQTNPKTVERAILDLNRAWAEAVTREDAAALEKIFSDDIVVISGSGNIRNKAEEIKDATASSDPYFIWMRPFTTENVRVRIYNNDAAVVTGLVKWTFQIPGRGSEPGTPLQPFLCKRERAVENCCPTS